MPFAEVGEGKRIVIFVLESAGVAARQDDPASKQVRSTSVWIISSKHSQQ
jgi:hypothetical protein